MATSFSTELLISLCFKLIQMQFCFTLFSLLCVMFSQARAKQRQFEIDSLHDSMFG